MDITKISFWRRSELLIQAMDWEWNCKENEGCSVLTDHTGLVLVEKEYPEEYLEKPDLYDERYMALAWRVLNFVTATETAFINHDMAEWWSSEYLCDLEPERAQVTWLDKCLELLIAAGLVPPEPAAE